MTVSTGTRFTPCLWFDGLAEQAAEFYVAIFPNSRINGVMRPSPKTPAITVEFELDGTNFLGLNGGPMFQFTEAISFQIHCADQAEVDYYWERLTADGGQESQCAWLKDRFGVSWQVVPAALPKLLSDPDPQRAQRAMQAMMGMRKIDIAAMQRAADGE